MAPKKSNKKVYLVVVEHNKNTVEVIAAYSTQSGADKHCEEADRDDLTVNEVTLDQEQETKAPKKTAKKAGTKHKREDDDDEEMEDDEDAEANNKKAKPSEARKQIAVGLPDALNGLKILFTGTFDMDRKTCEASAIRAGATIATTVNSSDIVVFGKKPGPKKVDEVEKKGIRNIDEAEFHQWLQEGQKIMKYGLTRSEAI